MRILYRVFSYHSNPNSLFSARGWRAFIVVVLDIKIGFAEFFMSLPSTFNMEDPKEIPATVSAQAAESSSSGIHYARRGSVVGDGTTKADENIDGYDDERMRARTLLSAQEEKKLMRRVDWRLMTLCSVMFLLKNIDADNVSNARIMNKGTHSNIMTELKMTSNEYNLVTTLYYVS